jgi:hypothetical protein
LALHGEAMVEFRSHALDPIKAFVLSTFDGDIRTRLAQLQTTPDPKNHFHYKFFQPNMFSSSSTTADQLRKKVEQAPDPWIWWSTSRGAPQN